MVRAERGEIGLPFGIPVLQSGIVELAIRRENADLERDGPLAGRPQFVAERAGLLAGRHHQLGPDAGDDFIVAFDGDHAPRPALQQCDIFGQIRDLLPGVEGVERSGQHERPNVAFVELLKRIEQGEAGGEAFIGLDERVARQQHKIDFVLDRQGDEAVEGGPGCVLDNRGQPRRQLGDFPYRLIEARISRVKKVQRRKSHTGEPPFSRYPRRGKCSSRPNLREERLEIR